MHASADMGCQTGDEVAPMAAWSAGLPSGDVTQRPLQQPCCELRIDGSSLVCLWGPHLVQCRQLGCLLASYMEASASPCRRLAASADLLSSNLCDVRCTICSACLLAVLVDPCAAYSSVLC